MLFPISPKRIPPSFHGPLTEEEMREDPGPEQVGLGYRAVSAVGVTEDVLVRFIVGYVSWIVGNVLYIRNMPF